MPVYAYASLKTMILDQDISCRHEADCFDPSFYIFDIYSERPHSEERKKIMVIFIRGYGWKRGDKSYLSNQVLLSWFVSQGCIFVPVNFRLAVNTLSQRIEIPGIPADITKSLKWLTINGRCYGAKK